MLGPAPPPEHHHSYWAPSPSSGIISGHLPATSKPPIHFSAPLIAMVVVVAAAFLLVTYSRLISRHLFPPFRRFYRWWRRLRCQHRFHSASSTGDSDSAYHQDSFDAFHTDDGFHVLSPYGLDDAVIKTIPLSVYAAGKNRRSSADQIRDCAVCLLEFEDGDCFRTLPACSHAFHVNCIDVWLRSHANCPLCRAGIFGQGSPFVPVMAARIRPSLDGVLEAIVLEQVSDFENYSEITPAIEESSPMTINAQSEDHRFKGGRDFLLKRSYSFSFERNSQSERMSTMEAATTSPWRFRRGSFWNKRPSPFGSLMTKPRVFSSRLGIKSPFFRRRGSAGGGIFFPLSESGARYAGSGGGGGGSSSRRTKSMTSPMFARPAAFPSSRLRCGDLEALLSPERYCRR